MTTDQPVSEFFTAGGTLAPDAPSYVQRPADDELFRYTMAGEFCYVLTPRQMGKSSLMIRTAQRLLNEGVKSAIVDLNQIGTAESEGQWYKGILTQIKRRLRLTVDPVDWWEQRKDIPNIQKFIDFFEEVLFEVKERVVIFIDEIDTTLELDFRDNFFIGIRRLFNSRAENPEFRRLSFILLGVASPSDLIEDLARTPFNIGQEILLRSFSRQDALKLEKGLEEIYPGFGRKILDRIFYWTNGHPYLTQKLCQIAVEQNFTKYSDQEIDSLIENNFLSEEASRETNLQFVRDRTLGSQSKRSVLKIYNSLLQGKRISEKKNSPEQIQLKLSGLVTVTNQNLSISNEIYRKVFDRAWVKKNAERDWRPVLIRLIVTLVVIVLISISIVFKDSIYLSQAPSKNQICFVIESNPEKRLRCLAELFQPNTILLPSDYSFIARDIFFRQQSWMEQESIFRVANPNSKDVETVINGLYTSLADVDRSGQNMKLLLAMQYALENLNIENSDLGLEIRYWIEAIRKTDQEDYAGALNEYNLAISLNPQNPATLFERARIYTRLEDYERALTDYEQVIAISPKSENEIAETPTITPTFTPTVSPTNTPTLLQLRHPH